MEAFFASEGTHPMRPLGWAGVLLHGQAQPATC
jgi:hypothetical protein